MAKKSVIARAKKRVDLSKQYASKRDGLRSKLSNLYHFVKNGSASRTQCLEVVQLQQALDNLPRNASPKRIRMRCVETGRARGVYRYFGLSRFMIRQYGMAGLLPGLRRSSW
jgi:small subunit ribosomal protein S14